MNRLIFLTQGNILILPHIHNQPVYEPGKPISEVARELGLAPEQFKKLASNENLWGPSQAVKDTLEQQIADLPLYPDGGAFLLTEAIAQHHGIETNQIILGNGSNEVIEMLAQVTLAPGDEVVIGADSFPVYKMATLQRQAVPVSVPMKDYRHDLEAMLEAVTDKTKLIFLPSPNNPTGTANTALEIEEFARKLPRKVLLVLDEAYIEYMDERAVDVPKLLEEGHPIFALRTFSKIYGIPALRVGYGYGEANVIRAVSRVRQPFNVNSFAQAAAVAAFGDRDHVQTIKRLNAENRQLLFDGLKELGLSPVPSEANFVFFPIENARDLFQKLLQKGWITRPIPLSDGSSGLRVTVYKEEWMKGFVAALGTLL